MNHDRPRRRNTTGVGGVVLREQEILVVRMTYGPSQGRYMLPGGLLDPGETLDVAVRREVREETGIIARPAGIIGVRSRYTERGTDTYLIWLLHHLSGEPRADQREISEARYMSLDEMDARDDVTYIVRYMARKVLTGEAGTMSLVEDYEYQMPGSTPDSWKLFL
jgi:8-oxo-dGTP diphosphatase